MKEKPHSSNQHKTVYTEDVVEQLYTRKGEIASRSGALIRTILQHRFRNTIGREHATYGLSRRLKTIERCVQCTFELLPPELEDVPEPNVLSDATINIQAFVFNLFGALDNVAWMWVRERNVTKVDGTPLPPQWVGLRSKNEIVWRSFSLDLQCFLASMDRWFLYLEDFRHALAHRIPLYIPPFVVSLADEAAYQKHGQKMLEAMQKRDLELYNQSRNDQTALAVFKPWITNASDGQIRSVLLHPQMLTDFVTLLAVAERLLEELGE